MALDIGKMKKKVKESGGAMQDIFYVKADSKVRIRFLADFSEGNEFLIHSSWEDKIDVPCLKLFGKDCPYCDGDHDHEDLKSKEHYGWPIWDYEAKKVRLMLYKINNMTPVNNFIDFYEEYGNLTDRDYTIKRTGSQLETKYTVIPGEEGRFRNKKAKPFTLDQQLEIIAKAFSLELDDDDEDEKPKKKGKGKSSKKDGASKKKKVLLKKLRALDEDEYEEVVDFLELDFDEYEDPEDLVEDVDPDEIKEAIEEVMG